ncbi:DUF6737 family protein [Thermocoleostomius sinensis]|jgi:hypothetical protein|uniref:DUF6737 domain-containing protein n=1 Tax=Thermocoleostomius sinensis A174 TaxID=2016057 RepID=A0A9E8ZMV3_9CYAN|nr:DUF6737 family protein [Thermocoleostomius sinensis]WAL61421.1 hypothetical protein OXH18_05370 [Thermocoleostomius sinensis A174]
MASSPPTVWHYKPWWCQPWSIVLTGIVAIGGSWWLLRLVWVTVLVAIPVLVWMGFFLLIYPQVMANDLANLANEQTQASDGATDGATHRTASRD